MGLLRRAQKRGSRPTERSSSLIHISYKNEILPSIDDEKDAVERMYHLQQSASDCNLGTLGAVQAGNLRKFPLYCGREVYPPGVRSDDIARWWYLKLKQFVQ